VTIIDDNAIGANHDPARGERPPTKRRMAGSASSRSQPTAYPYDAQAAVVKHDFSAPVPHAPKVRGQRSEVKAIKTRGDQTL
jgi:hypothetical protein